jgi:2-dehydro-3-deoxyphosphooctonate aldolase (KDO 8-P synthase)
MDLASALQARKTARSPRPEKQTAAFSWRKSSRQSLARRLVGRNTLGGKKLLFILGPCVIESAAFTRRIARKLKTICDDLGAQFVFKASYDKANRTSGSSFRGTNVREGCQLLAEIGHEVGAPVTTDVHSPAEVGVAREYIDLIQVPAFLCRQTDLVLAAGASGRVVNVKKGQFLAPWDVKNIAAKLQSAGCRAFFFTERGATFGYNNLVADMRSIYWMQQLNYQVIFDATHSVQRPGGAGDRTAGDGELAPILARAAVAAGCDGVFIETHENPAKALSDGPNQIPLRSLPSLLRLLTRIRSEVVP